MNRTTTRPVWPHSTADRIEAGSKKLEHHRPLTRNKVQW